VVHLLEVIPVGEDQPERAAEALDAADLALERLLELPAVRELGQAVRDRLACQLTMQAGVLERNRGLPAEPVGPLASLVREVLAPGHELENGAALLFVVQRNLQRAAARQRIAADDLASVEEKPPADRTGRLDAALH